MSGIVLIYAGYESVISMDSKWERGDFSTTTPSNQKQSSAATTTRTSTFSSGKNDQSLDGSKLSKSLGDDEFRKQLREIEVIIDILGLSILCRNY